MSIDEALQQAGFTYDRLFRLLWVEKVIPAQVNSNGIVGPVIHRGLVELLLRIEQGDRQGGSR